MLYKTSLTLFLSALHQLCIKNKFSKVDTYFKQKIYERSEVTGESIIIYIRY